MKIFNIFSALIFSLMAFTSMYKAINTQGVEHEINQLWLFISLMWVAHFIDKSENSHDE